MSYTVGLDFGTHQTKVCIEDASNPAQKIYEFIEFNDLEGNKSVLLPSIVQINNDDTICYGFVDDNRCKTISNVKTAKPQLELPPEPILELPEKPRKINNKDIPNWKNKLLHLKNKLIHKKTEYDIQMEKWIIECTEINNEYNYNLEQYKREREQNKQVYEKSLARWKTENLSKEHIFRYFKLATFSNYHWNYAIRPEIISVWYLTFVFFKIQEKYGADFYIQMGVPYSTNEKYAEIQKTVAFKILISANLLISKYQNLDAFLKAKHTDLLKNTELSNYTEQDIQNYGINVMPEAFAGLRSITQHGKLYRGMHLLVDIGGGTTDIAFFSISDDNLPNVHVVLSFPQGLNFIFEKYLKKNDFFSIPQVQQLFKNSQKEFMSFIVMYHNSLKNKTNDMIKRVESEFLRRQTIHGLNINKLRKALQDMPVVYCGGGSMYNAMRIPLSYFTDVRLIDKGLLNIPYVKNKNIDISLFTILATAYGLSIQLEYEIKMTPIENIFDHLPPKEKNYDLHKEYGLEDT